MLAPELVLSSPLTESITRDKKKSGTKKDDPIHSIAAQDTDKRVVVLSTGEAEDFWWIAASANCRSDVLEKVYGERFMHAVPIAGGKYKRLEGDRAHIVVRPAAAMFLCRSVAASLSGLDLVGNARRDAIELATNDHLDKLLKEEQLRCLQLVLERQFLLSSYQ